MQNDNYKPELDSNPVQSSMLSDGPLTPQDGSVRVDNQVSAQLPVSPITHAPAVAVGRFSSGLGMIWTGLILNLVGLYPLLVLLSSLSQPHFMTTVGAWLVVSPFFFIGAIMSASGVKEKGYQNLSIRIFAVVSFFIGILFFFIPVVASLLYGLRIGT